jgi:acetyl esterase/lipase
MASSGSSCPFMTTVALLPFFLAVFFCLLSSFRPFTYPPFESLLGRPRAFSILKASFFFGWLTSEIPLHLSLVFSLWALAINRFLIAAPSTWYAVMVFVGLSVARSVVSGWLVRREVARRAAGLRSPRALRALNFALGWRDVLRMATIRPAARLPGVKMTTVSYGNHHRNKADLYTSATSAQQKKPVILYCHGGGWQIGERTHIPAMIEWAVAHHGMVGVSISYRLVSKVGGAATVKDCVDDVNAAVQFVHGRCGDWGGDKDKIVLVGGSAGGHLVAMAALSQPELIRAAIPIYAVFNMSGLPKESPESQGAFRRWVTRVLMANQGHLVDSVSPVHVLASRKAGHPLPRLLFVHGTTDNLTPIAFLDEMVSVAKDKGIKVEELRVPNAHHAFDITPSPFSTWPVQRLLTAWILENTEK